MPALTLCSGARGSVVPSLPAATATTPLLELRGRRLELLLRGLLSTALLRTALAERYGLGAEQLRRLQDAGFALRLLEQPQGPYRAGLQLLVRLPGERQFLGSLVDRSCPSARGSRVEPLRANPGPAAVEQRER